MTSKMRDKLYFLSAALFLGVTAFGWGAESPSGAAPSAPPVPAGLTAAVKGNGIQLSWDSPSSANGFRFNLYLADEKGKMGRKISAQPISDNHVFLEKMKMDKTYRFVLTTVSPSGMESAPTAPLVTQLPDEEKASSTHESQTDLESTPTQKEDSPEKDEEEPFKPDWTGDVGYTFSIQPSSLGQGQYSQELSLSGNYSFTEGGHYVSFKAGGGQQVLEGVNTSFGAFSLGGGLGFGFFLPSLDISFQQGAQALNSLDGTLTLTFQFFKPLSLGLILEGSPQNHQGALFTILGGTSDQIDEIDSVDLTGGAVITFMPWDFLAFTLTGEQDYSTTYQWQDILHRRPHSLNQTETIPSITLGSEIIFLDHLTLSLSLQEGEQDIPAGVSYNPITKKTVNSSAASTQTFSGYSFGLSYGL